MSIFVLLARLLISPCYYQHIMMKLFNLCQFNKQKWYYVHLICIYLINSEVKHFLIFLRLDFFFFFSGLPVHFFYPCGGHFSLTDFKHSFY